MPNSSIQSCRKYHRKQPGSGKSSLFATQQRIFSVMVRHKQVQFLWPVKVRRFPYGPYKLYETKKESNPDWSYWKNLWSAESICTWGCFWNEDLRPKTPSGQKRRPLRLKRKPLALKRRPLGLKRRPPWRKRLRKLTPAEVIYYGDLWVILYSNTL